VDNINPAELQIVNCKSNGWRDARRRCPLYFKPSQIAAIGNKQIDFHTGMGRPEIALFAIRFKYLHQIFYNVPFQGSADFRVTQQIISFFSVRVAHAAILYRGYRLLATLLDAC